jgi:putative ABC transport system substrate-binding protein
MDRRTFIGRIAGSLLVAPLAAETQPTGKLSRIGVIGERTSTDPFLTAFRQGLRDLGYIEGQNIVIEYRYANGVVDRFPDFAVELTRLNVDVLVVGGTLAARSAKAATATVPIVFTVVGDPVGTGLVASLARPGGNATGLSNIVSELSAKQLELLKAAVPRISRVAILHNPLNSGPALIGTREAARALAVELEVVEVRLPNELPSVFSTLTGRHADAVLALSDPVFGNEAQLARLAAEHRLPTMYARREFAVAGGLLAYGPNFSNNWRRAASYVDKILKGTKPGDLPVEQPTTFEFVINVKTAKALKLTIPPSVLSRADEVIQ